MPIEGVHLFGIRHHGPGSARSLVCALERLDPDIVLIEGPPEADELLPLAAHPDLEPPVALLVYAADRPQSAVLYPFAEFSPEWQAMQFALERELPMRFIDLPQSIRFAEGDLDETRELRGDPLAPLAEAAGFGDAERWWDRLVESRAGNDEEVFVAIHEMMTTLRAELDEGAPLLERRREAHMRKSIRAARAEGFVRIAVVCGAYHTPALQTLPSARSDEALLKGLPKIKTAAAWVPWSYERLAAVSGYGAGIESPVWYEFLWQSRDSLGARWIGRAARLLREEDLPVSSAHVIETCRLAEALSAVREHPLPGLAEYNDAAVAVLGSGDGLVLRLISSRWHFDARLGKVPAEFPAAPLQRDLAALQKRLRLPPRADEQTYDLDLREAFDRERSHVLRRLRVLGIEWGIPAQNARAGRGTFHELWQLRWHPEFAIALISASRLGHTVEQAATAAITEQAAGAASLAALVRLLEDAIFADLGAAVAPLVAAIENRAAAAADVQQLLEAVPPLVSVRRYGSVRETDSGLVDEILAGLVPRVFIGLVPATAGLDDDAARAVWRHLVALDGSLKALGRQVYIDEWLETLCRLVERETTHALLAGYAHRQLYEAEVESFEAMEQALSRTLSAGNEPQQAAAWIEGMLSGSSMVLIHDDRLRGLLDGWVRSVPSEHFLNVLPLLRRTFAQFPAPERRMLGERLRSGSSPPGAHGKSALEFDEAAARAVLPVLALIWNKELPS